MIIDARCPKCNRPVRGRDECPIVKSEKDYAKVEQCPHCKTPIQLKPMPPGELGDFFFDTRR